MVSYQITSQRSRLDTNQSDQYNPIICLQPNLGTYSSNEARKYQQSRQARKCCSRAYELGCLGLMGVGKLVCCFRWTD